MGLNKDTVEKCARVAWQRCEALAHYTEERGKLTRTFLCPAMKEVHATVSEWMTQAGLAVRFDGVGNIIGSRPAPHDEAPVYTIGSHLDTVPDGGLYDGQLGVMAGIAVADILRDENLPFGLEVVGFSEEEGIRFNLPFIGSHGYAGTLTSDMLDRMDSGGVTVRDAIQRFGFNPSEMLTQRSAPKNLAGYFELHLEQGSYLEDAGLSTGVVYTIAGQVRLECFVNGEARHAGSTPMNKRHDALQAAAEMVLLTEKICEKYPELVMTTGVMEVAPNAANCIPGSVRFTIDTRHPDAQSLQDGLQHWLRQAREIAVRRNVDFLIKSEHRKEPVPMSPSLSDRLIDSVRSLHGNPMELVSWAGHDVMVMASACDVGLLLVRCHDGISHHPDEYVTEEDAVAAIHVLAQCMDSLRYTEVVKNRGDS